MEVKPLEMCVNPICPGKISWWSHPGPLGVENKLKHVFIPITGKLSAYLCRPAHLGFEAIPRGLTELVPVT